MGKFEDYGVLAEKYYVEEQLPISTIAKKLNLTDKTLHDWKNKGKWEDKRKDFLSSQYTCTATLQELLIHVVRKVNEEIKVEGKMPDGATLNFIGKMSEKLPKLKSYEEAVLAEKITETVEKEDSGDMQKRIADLIDKKLMGLD